MRANTRPLYGRVCSPAIFRVLALAVACVANFALPTPASADICCNFAQGQCATPGVFNTCPAGYTFVSGGSCSDCFGACCLPNGTCTNTGGGICGGLGGQFFGFGSTCNSQPCPGACCFSNGTCQYITLGQCQLGGGTFQGIGVGCNPCPQLGACCFFDGSCQLLLQSQCGGTSWQAGTCSPNNCPQRGACCLGDGSCQFVILAACGGVTWQAGGTCSPNNCPQRGACCSLTGACTFVLQALCSTAVLPGGWIAGGTCSPVDSCPKAACYIARWASPTTDARAIATFELAPPPDLLNPGNNDYSGAAGMPGAVMTNLCITVSGATSGNGYWDQADFDQLYLNWPVALNLSKEWVGQAQTGLSKWGFGSWDPNFASNHDFNLFSLTAGGPDGTNFYTLTTNGGAGESMRLVSFVRCEAGACCTGAMCMVALRSACTGASFFVGPGTTCNPPGRTGTSNICCKADFNNSGNPSPQDIFDYLGAYFAGCP